MLILTNNENGIPIIYEVDKISQEHSDLCFYAPAMTWMHGERRYVLMRISLRTQSEAITAFKELYKNGKTDLSEYRTYCEER